VSLPCAPCPGLPDDVSAPIEFQHVEDIDTCRQPFDLRVVDERHELFDGMIRPDGRLVRQRFAHPEIAGDAARLELHHGGVPRIPPGVAPTAWTKHPLVAVRNLLPTHSQAKGTAIDVQPFAVELPDVERVLDRGAARKVGVRETCQKSMRILELNEEPALRPHSGGHVESDTFEQHVVVVLRFVPFQRDAVTVFGAQANLTADVQHNGTERDVLQGVPGRSLLGVRGHFVATDQQRHDVHDGAGARHGD
jgi:hypothetical protein